MKKSQIKVLYVSTWAEGSVESSAMLNLITGEVTDIEKSECGADYEHHIRDDIQVSIEGEIIEVGVDNIERPGYFVMEARDLAAIFASARFEILTEVAGVFENTETHDDAPVYFHSLEAARADLEDHLLEISRAIASGDMDGEVDPSEYRICDFHNQEIFELDWEAVETGGLVFMGSDTTYTLDEEQPMTCPSCGSRTDFVEMAYGKQRHNCLNASCGRLFFASEDDDNQQTALVTNAVKEQSTQPVRGGDLFDVAKLIEGKLTGLGFKSKGKKIKHIQVLEVAAAIMGFRNRHAAALNAKPAASELEITSSNRVRLIFDVDYALNDESIGSMADNLRLMVQYAMEEGMITNGSTAEVEDYKVQVLTGSEISEARPTFSVMLMAKDENQTFTWCEKAIDPNEAISLAMERMNQSRQEAGAPDALDESEVSVLFVAEGEVKYRCAPGDIDESRFYLHP